MKDYPEIGTHYALRISSTQKIVYCMVIENNSNNKTTTLKVVSNNEYYGKTFTVNSQLLYEKEALLIAPIEKDEEIVIKNGIEYIKKKDRKIK